MASTQLIKDLEEAVARMEKDKEELVECSKKVKIAKEPTLESFQADDIKVKFYTDLPSFLTVKILFNFMLRMLKNITVHCCPTSSSSYWF